MLVGAASPHVKDLTFLFFINTVFMQRAHTSAVSDSTRRENPGNPMRAM